MAVQRSDHLEKGNSRISCELIVCHRRLRSWLDAHLDELLGDEQSLRGDLVKGVSHTCHHGRDEGGDVGVEGVSRVCDHDDVETGQGIDF